MRVGLTGGIAAGKSTVARLLSEHGAVIIDSDQIAREVVAPGTPGLGQVVGAFGGDVLAADGSLDRAALGAIVFADPARRQVLEGIVWPLVGQRSAELLAEASEEALIVHDIPLLVETGQQANFEAVIVVDAPREVQIDRMVRDRGMTIEEAEARLAAQIERAERLAAATHVVENTGNLDDLRHRVAEVVSDLREQ